MSDEAQSETSVTPRSALEGAQARLDEEIAIVEECNRRYMNLLRTGEARLVKLRHQHAVIVEFISRTLSGEVAP